MVTRLLKRLWGLTGPVRRPIQDRLARFLSDCAAKAVARVIEDEVTLVLDTLVAEQFRLQEQIDRLEELLRETIATRIEPGIAIGDDDQP
jgi:hypothetical protein